MQVDRHWRLAYALLIAASFAIPAAAQQPPAPAASPPATTPAKPKPAPKPAVKPTPKPEAKPGAAAAPAKPSASPTSGARLLGQYGEWGAYTASPGGKKVCFAISKPTSADHTAESAAKSVYMFISTRPADKVANEVSIIVGYPFKPGTEASATVGSTPFALYTQQDGAWIKNAANEANMVAAMRSGETAVVKGVSAKGTQSTDSYTLKGVSQALDRVAQECK